MGLNKKRIAERQQALAKAQKAEKNKKLSNLAGIIAASALGVALLVLLVVIVIDGTKTNQKNEETEKPQAKDYYADIVIEDYGTITLELDGDAAPVTVENFVKLAKEGFYDGLTFHRIIKGFMMQGGCPNGDGTGDAGKDIVGEFSLNGWDNPIKHERGVISMARGNEPDSASCQFFIVHETSAQNTASLDGRYAAFGRVTSGIEIVDQICNGAKPFNDNGAIAKDSQPVIKSIVIRDK